jgi:hypothetical protein
VPKKKFVPADILNLAGLTVRLEEETIACSDTEFSIPLGRSCVKIIPLKGANVMHTFGEFWSIMSLYSFKFVL